nr:putative prohibitin (PHB) [Polytomella parva]|mmetsp:Transcript_26005/g.47547  ORF Transcript_26005/g.47547 Transcript_26005/m.47547 type:complete len:283 (-) Transcript_26005:455-1303(-)|eukprot:CAMPEP_0175075538 /NCGR_PEP_ID=MMETSP0052_2-20121109/22074_1 /TAXON_ID=51329 ORGANISM="Polytomella parva, Strain SAG 63-3" /NCGR_SAMPLE_ID=MMETSP0052_2 /ASSEMBLY_ACC=CAM_ASM_000194 /LENGTH=282 /DNA_ID=CAMNT_0016344271 /DNA_START=87 /DNA_END=935 /DNA_ORIENTATION=+
MAAPNETAQLAINVLNKVIRYAVGLGVTVSALQTSLYNVDGGERAIIFDRFRGVLPEAVGEGTHVRIPWIQTPHIMDIKTRPRTINSVTGTKDLQMVNMSLRILSKPEEARLPWMFKSLGLDWEERVLPSIANEIVKAVVAQYNAEQLLTQRDKVSRAVRDHLLERSADFGIILEDVAITHLSFGAEFTRAVEMKQVAEQDAERAKFVVMKAEQERNAAVIRAEGESESAKLISEATKQFGSGLIELRRLEAAKDIADTMSKSRNVVYIPGSGNLLMNIGSN